MKDFFCTLPRNIILCFRGYNVLWHVAAILLTYAIVISDFDWKYFVFFRDTKVFNFLFPAVILGGLLPIVVPLTLLALGKAYKKAELVVTGWAVGQAAVIGVIISSLYKAFTGRIEPDLTNTITDISHGFQFGFLRHGIFWGWPSSHTMIAFAMAFTLIYLYPKNKWLRAIVLLYALYVGFGVSMSIHWFSEFAAGAIIGIVIGKAVGTSFNGGLQKER